MNPATARRICTLCLLAVGVTPLAAQKWQVQYFYDKAKSSFSIVDLQFPTPQRGIAVGVIQEGSRREPSSIVTSDGGAHWQTVALKEEPVSLFFLSENVGWLVTQKGVWQTLEAGRSWTKLPKPPGELRRVYFLNETHGFGVGPKKTALETNDGGKVWTKLPAAAPTQGENPGYSAFNWIAFATPEIGLITGWNIPPKRFGPRLPAWVEPEEVLQQRETPHLSYTMATANGGKTWTPDSGSLFGVVARVRFAPKGLGIGLIEYGEGFRYPSEAYTISWPSGITKTMYRDPKFSISDVWLASDGTAYLAGTQVRGQLRNLLPSKVQVMTSRDLKNWKTIPVDYRAEAVTTVLAAADDQHLWMATNTGMILKLVQ